MTARPAQENQANKHIPVLLDEVVVALKPADGEVYVDGTFGAGGYTRAVLDAADCSVVAIDRDPDAIDRAKPFVQTFGDRFQICEGCFGDMDTLLAASGRDAVDGVMLDVGVSSYQLDEAERGFSFREDGPLDMRMSAAGESAADVVNTYEEARLADIIYQYGEERKSRRIASAIVKRRAEQLFSRTLDLAGLIEAVIGRPPVQTTARFEMTCWGTGPISLWSPEGRSKATACCREHRFWQFSRSQQNLPSYRRNRSG